MPGAAKTYQVASASLLSSHVSCTCGCSCMVKAGRTATSGPRDGLDVHCIDGLTNGSWAQLQTVQLVALSTGRTQGDNTPIEVARA
jgi:hypothetical protein